MSNKETPTIEAPQPSLSEIAAQEFGNEYVGEVSEPIEEPAEQEEVETPEEEVSEEAQEDAAEEESPEESDETPIASIQELIETNEWDSEWFDTLEVPVKINGEEGKAKYSDLVASYQTQEAANQRLEDAKNKAATQNQELAEKQQAVESNFAVAAELITHTENLLNEDIAAIDWKELEIQDPADAALKRLKFQERHQKLEALKGQAIEKYQSSISQTQEEQEQSRQEALQAESQKLLAIFPDWQDAEKREAGQKQIASYLLGNGFSQDEIAQAADSRMIQISHKAMLYDQGMAKTEVAKKKIATVPKSLKPGAKKSTDQINTEKRNKQMAKLQKSGNIEDAVALLM